MTSELYVAMDIEADGPIPGLYSMLSLGAATVEEPEKQKTFYMEFQPISESFVEEAMRVNGLDRERLKREGAAPSVAMKIFSQWVQDIERERDVRVVGVYGPAVWDGMWVHWYFMRFLRTNPFGVTGSGIDLRSYFMGMVNGTWRKTGKKEIINRLRLDKSSRPPHTHNAKDDAVELAWFFSALQKQQSEWNTRDKMVLINAAERLGVYPAAKRLVE
jgi:DNA polymerase III epsilon subunit-like protein